MDMLQNGVQCVWQAGAALGEGPFWSVREQALYWVDILNHRLHRYAPFSEQQQATWQFDEEITSVAERKNADGLIVTLRHGFAFFDPRSEKLERLLQAETDLPGNRFNDGKCDKAGRYWAGTMDFEGKMPIGSLYSLTKDYKLEKLDSGYPVTNGPAWSLDYKTMYFNDSANGCMYAFDFEIDTGKLHNKRVFQQFDEKEGSPDGMTIDAEGGLWVAHWGAGKVTRRDFKGDVLQTIELPCSQITSCAFGGPELSTLFITSAAHGLSSEQRQQEPLAGGLFAIELAVSGLEANTFAG
jgi:sugar lactone lactonase YvrE